jgi:CRISPR-associated protein Cas5d
MSFGVRLHVWGERACFTRPEMKVERVSYDVITPSAARGLLEAIYWKPAIVWIVDRIHVLKPIRFQSFRRNEVGAVASGLNAKSAMKRGDVNGLGLIVENNRQQRATMLLTDVAYVIEAHFELTARAGTDDDPAKHAAMFTRRAEKGQCFHRPCLGAREFPADFALLTAGVALPDSELPDADRDRDLGWMLHDINFRPDGTAKRSNFFRARLTGGVLDVKACLAREGVAA